MTDFRHLLIADRVVYIDVSYVYLSTNRVTEYVYIYIYLRSDYLPDKSRPNHMFYCITKNHLSDWSK